MALDGSGSNDPDGDPLTFKWQITSQPSGGAAVLSDQSTVMPTFFANVPGEYKFQLIVNDSQEDSLPEEVVITTGNTAPVADAGPDQSMVDVGNTVTLDGSGSSDVDGDPLTFQWSLTTVPAGSAATLSDPTAVMPTFVADLPGMYVAQLIVNDGTEDSLPDTVVIDTENLRPVAEAGSNQNVQVDDTVQLDGSSSSDADNDPLTFAWSLTTKPAGSNATLSDPTLVNLTFVADLPGTYVVQLIVNDGTIDSVPDTIVINTPTGASLQCGDLVSGSIDIAGEEEEFTFSGQAGQVVAITLADTGFAGAPFPQAFVFSPTGVQVTSSFGPTQREVTLPESGTYVIKVRANDLTSSGRMRWAWSVRRLLMNAFCRHGC